MERFKQWILQEAPASALYPKFYDDIDIGAYDQITKADPTAIVKGTEVKKMGKYSKWLLDRYRKNDFDITEVEWISKSLESFKGDVSKLKSVKDLQNNDNGIEVVYKDSDWIVEIPKTYEASCNNYGKHTGWCTASERNGSSYYDKYKSDGELYVIKRKGKESKELYQLFIADDKKRTEFQDKKNNNDLDLDNFWAENSKLKDFFVKKIGLKIIPKFKMAGREFTYEIKNGVYYFDDIDLLDANLNTLGELVGLGEYHVKGIFDVSNNYLTSLEGSPQTVGGHFDCSNNKLTSLEESPKTVGGDFYGSYNKLTSLKGSPKTVGGDFYCSDNKLTSLEGSPKTVGGDFNGFRNQLTSLEGSPKTVGGYFRCAYNSVDFTIDDVKAVSNVKSGVISV